MQNRISTIVLISVILLTGCGKDSDHEEEPQLVPSMKELENMVYRSDIVDSGFVRLVNGTFSQHMNDRAGTILVTTLTTFRLTGHLNSYREGAVVVLQTAGGAGSVYFDLAAVVKDSSGVHNVASVMLGDRVKIRSMSLDGGMIHLQMATHAPDEPMCCPTQEVMNLYTLRGDKLALLSSEPFQQ